jgi:hypothetical protein
MLAQLPTELIQKIAIYASPLIDLAVAPISSTSVALPTTYNSNHKFQPQPQPQSQPQQGNVKPVIFFDVSPPTVVTNLSATCRQLKKCLKFSGDNAVLWARIFERTFDFDAPRRRLGLEWAGAHGLAWEGRRRWNMFKRIRRAVAVWEDGMLYFLLIGVVFYF